MSTKLIPIGGICAALLWGSTALAQTNNEPIHTRIPLGKAKAVLENNAAQQPQSQGLENALGRVEANQQRFIEKHVLSPADTAEPSAESAASKTSGSESAESIHTRIPLEKAKAVLENNAAQQPQSQGLGNAQGRVEANQQRFIEKHVLSPTDTAEPSTEPAASKTSGSERDEPIHTHIPLEKAKAVLENNAAQQPQSQGLEN